MSGATDSEAPVAADTGGASALAVLRFVAGYWRDVPYRFTGMVVGTLAGVLLEVQIPRLSADLVVVVERLLRGAAEASEAWMAAGWLIGLFGATSVVKQIYLRNWMYLTSQVMQKILGDGFRRVQRFSSGSRVCGGVVCRR